MAQLRSKKYMRRIQVGGHLGTVEWISKDKKRMLVKHSEEIGLGDAGSISNPDHASISLPRPSSVTQVGQKVRISARPI